ncbi:hypothetical protein B188_27780 [Candidatus Brocadiaceae bacterium B188]|jgi:hemerythrin-like domain-containing protein|nr:hemerythrin domain-containing protein [Candidatus Brocadia sapporoensis]MEB2309710.1 hemerythrin domain-containing protein [Candidatus Brocadiaceae bacterium]OQZ03343.1 MAG: hypothetical protein B6D34_07580 [Candidatus Brocadia sp. UTAMX1]QQR65985.1 MAG: hemerythrin domain-containing protein [Candidatus Brocadia sp.]RZV56877.1 MAG: hypothetical protein EX330_11425 [Candidatus Brocadia sp. BROELEC01]TWU50347.1 hypothetical protein B188_27780 [Candidatus Brocadiaceae bacterium B188]
MKQFLIPFIVIACTGITSCTSSKNRVYQEHTHLENTNQSVTDILHNDFDVVKRVLHLLEKATYCLEHEKPVSKESFQDLVKIISGFSDKHHQEKEDKVLFPALKIKNEGEKKDFLGRLLMEHVSARDEIRNLTSALINFDTGKKAKKKIAKISRSYIRSMNKHIEVEEKLLFPWINKVLTSDEQAMFIKKFNTLEKEDLESGVHEKYSIMIERLEQQLGNCSE